MRDVMLDPAFDVDAVDVGETSAGAREEDAGWLVEVLRNGLSHELTSFDPRPSVGRAGRCFPSRVASVSFEVDAEPSVFVDAMDEAGDVLGLGVSPPLASSLSSLAFPFTLTIVA